VLSGLFCVMGLVRIPCLLRLLPMLPSSWGPSHLSFHLHSFSPQCSPRVAIALSCSWGNKPQTTQKTQAGDQHTAFGLWLQCAVPGTLLHQQRPRGILGTLFAWDDGREQEVPWEESRSATSKPQDRIGEKGGVARHL
jgi:hypothetical protein